MKYRVGACSNRGTTSAAVECSPSRAAISNSYPPLSSAPPIPPSSHRWCLCGPSPGLYPACLELHPLAVLRAAARSSKQHQQAAPTPPCQNTQHVAVFYLASELLVLACPPSTHCKPSAIPPHPSRASPPRPPVPPPPRPPYLCPDRYRLIDCCSSSPPQLRTCPHWRPTPSALQPTQEARRYCRQRKGGERVLMLMSLSSHALGLAGRMSTEARTTTHRC